MNRLDKSSCSSCEHFSASGLKKMGVNTDQVDYVVALAGNPNTGKSTVFNAMTGLKQHTGNWPGKTVSRAEGAYSFGDKKYKIIDLPGTYSLLSTSVDEEVARDFLLFGRPDVTIVTADASRLERNLNLILQILAINGQAVLCLNLMDEANRNKIEIDVRTLSRKLGIPVIPTVARTQSGIPKLLEAIHDVATGKIKNRPRVINNMDSHVEESITQISKKILEQFPSIPNSRWLAFRLLEGDKTIIKALQTGAFEYE